MLWLYILIGILVFIGLLLLIPIKVYASCDPELKCNLYIGFVKISLYPQKQKKKKPKKSEKQAEKKSEEKKKKLPDKEEIKNFVSLIKKIADLAVDVLKDFFKHIIVKNLKLGIKIVGEDAADTAVKYGYCCSAVYPAFSAIVSSVRCRDYGVEIQPNFNEKAESELYFEVEAKILLLWLVGLVIKHGIKGIKLLLK